MHVSSSIQIRNQLRDYFIDGSHLILFITKHDTLNETAYENLRFIDDALLKKQVPVLCVVNGSDNTQIYKYIQIYQNVLLDMRSERDCITSIQRLWQLIEDGFLTSSIKQNHIHHRNNSPDTTRDDQLTLNLSSEIHAQPAVSSNQSKQADRSYDEFSHEWKSSVVPRMFDERNTSVENLMNRCHQYQAQNHKYNCVLLTTGSLNPIHRSHINNLELVRGYLKQSKSQWNVLAGYLSPTHDSYVRSKLGKATIPGRDRCDLCERAIREHEHETQGSCWLSVSRAECEYRHGFVDFGPTTEALCQYLNSLLVLTHKFLKHPLYVIYVCGLDHFNKCSDVRRLAKEKWIKCAVIYRKNTDERSISELDESSNIIYVPLADERTNLIDISSTEIRLRWEKNSPELTQFTYASVINRLKEMRFHF